ncbi:hypothetical protein ACFYP4_31655 [Streptomyces sp. NPDC005551]|uniref:effector-associated constant component EACC1 n=1 Tax=unclassified Streptomyces TaxID=2593676 RepID=UPI0033CA83D7
MTDFVAGIAEVPAAAGAQRTPDTGEALGSEDELRSLLRWLHADETLDVRARIGGEPAAAQHMGSGFDLLQLALGSGLSTASLVVSVLQWQSSRRRAPAVTLRRGEVEVLLTAEAARDEETLRRIVGLLDGEEAESDLDAP